jgi:hypothetical protein
MFSSNRMLLDFISRWMIWGMKPWWRNMSPRAEPRQILRRSSHPIAPAAFAWFLIKPHLKAPMIHVLINQVTLITKSAGFSKKKSPRVQKPREQGYGASPFQ